MPPDPYRFDQIAPLGDRQLVQLARESVGRGAAGRETAKRCVGLVVARHRELVRVVIAAKVPIEAIDDLESMVLARFAAKVYSGDEITNPVGLLVRMAQFMRADFHAGRRPAELPIEDWDAGIDDGALASLEIEDGVEELLSPLSARQRDVVWQRVIEGRTSAEVAARQQTRPGNIDVIVHRALIKMREALG